MGKWYIETGSIREVITAEGSGEAYKLGLARGIERASYNEEEFELSELITASEQGFLTDNPELDVLYHTTSVILRAIGEEEMAVEMEEEGDEEC